MSITIEGTLDFLRSLMITMATALVGASPILGLILIDYLGHPLGLIEGAAFQIGTAAVMIVGLALTSDSEKFSISWRIGLGFIAATLVDVIIGMCFPIMGLTPRMSMIHLMPTLAVLILAAYAGWDRYRQTHPAKG